MAYITGFGGKFPSSGSSGEFWENLCQGVDLVTEARYPTDYYDLPNRQGKITSIEKFDAMFFGVSSAQALCLDPQIRLLLEAVFEAITDAGYTMADLARTNTGVYVGGCFSDLHTALLSEMRTISGYENTGCSHTMFSNRVSFYFNFLGPSMTIDTACSSSLVAFDQAVRDVKSGKVSRAIVGGVSVAVHPGVFKSFHAYNMLSPNGKCHSFDDAADGYVRADGIGAVLIESASIVKNGIARIIGTGTNSDGWKKNGITFPDSEQQIALCRSVCAEYNVDTKAVSYVEAHGTGTVAGDGQELRAIDTVYGGDTLIGSVKSNMGHSEGASGIMSLLKVLGILNDSTIPMNLHYKSTHHDAIVKNRLTVVDTTRPFNGGLIAINNFGFGGSNAHVVTEHGNRPFVDDNKQTRFVFGRTKAALERYHSTGDLNAAAWAKLMRSSTAANKFPWRGVAHKDGQLETNEIAARAPVAFCFGGQGCQWNGMAMDLWSTNATFQHTVRDSCVGLDVDLDLLFGTGELWMEQRWSGLGITLVQLGLTAMLAEAGVRPDFIFGHSVGEVACGFADGCTSAREAARIAFVRCHLSSQVKSDGLMIAAGLTLEEAKEVIKSYKNTVIACHNSPDGVTLSGSAEEIDEITSSLHARGVFAKLVPTDGVAYHSIFFKKSFERICNVLSEVITDTPVARSDRWISTSDAGDRPYADAIYHAANIVGMVNFAPVVASLPEGTLVIEIGPHALLKSILKRCNPSVGILKTMVKGQSAVDSMVDLLDALWLGGAEFEFPKVCYNVPMAKRVKLAWDHEKDWHIPDYKDFAGSGGATVVTYDLAGKDSYLMDHVIDGRSLFPATGHVYTAWQVYATPEIHFANVKIHSAIILDGVSVSFTVQANESSWKVFHEDNLVSEGTVCSNIAMPASSSVAGTVNPDDSISKEVVYSTFARHGYEYRPHFQLIQSRSLDGRTVQFGETQHWIVYLDNMLQAFLKDPKGLNLPTGIESISVRCKDVKDAGLTLNCHAKLQAVCNEFVAIRGLKTTVSRKVHKKPSIQGVEFVPYGRHVVISSEDYKRQVIKELYRKLQGPTRLSSLACEIDEHSAESAHVAEGPLMTFLKESRPSEAAKPDTLKSNLLIELTSTPSLEELCTTDPALSFTAFEDGLHIVSQVIRENLSREYTVLEYLDMEVPYHNVGENFSRSFYSFTQCDVMKQVSAAGKHWNASNMQCLNQGINDTTAKVKVDVIVTANTLHLATSLRSTLLHLYDSIQEDGMLVLHEQIGALPSLLWGSGPSAVDSSESRDHGQWLSKEAWLAVLRKYGFEPIVWFVDQSETQLLLLAKKVFVSEELRVVDQVQDREGIRVDTPIVVNTTDFGYLGMVRSIRKEPGFSSVQLSLDVSKDLCNIEEDCSEIATCPLLPMSVKCGNAFGGMHEVTLRPAAGRKDRGFHVEVPFPGDLSSLRWVENDCAPNCDVEFCGINFKDVMLAYGKLTSAGSVKIGLEFSGTMNGQSVMGISAGCMATQVRVSEHLVWPLPSHFTLESACTVPVVYSTVYYALVCKANIQAGQTVLIHSVAGGVGQAAFHVCSRRGVNVIVTCSKDKVEWVHTNLGIAKSNILDSRTVAFRDGVMELTNGRGVDVVLNSLSGDKLHAGLACVAPYGHFCEIGKYDIQQNMAIGLGIFERNVSIHGFDLGDMFDRPVQWKQIRDLVSAGLTNGEIVPLCTTVFDDIEPALRCISAGKHIGKVLVRVHRPGQALSSSASAQLPVQRYFKTHGTHVVIGGLGGFGLEMVAFLWSRGAERIIVISRSGPKIHQRNHLGAATVSHVNLADPDACDEFISSLGSALVGLWHLGMVLNDRLYTNMTDAAWNETVNVKAVIASNVDRSTRRHSSALEHFVMWSSVSALFGNPGQTNYAYANSVMEFVCMRRKKDGLPGLAVQWGFIGNVGVMMHVEANTSLAFSPQHIDNCLESFDTILFSDHAVVSSYLRQSKAAAVSGGQQQSVAQRVARVLGIDLVKAKASDTLSSLGMDSLQSVEVANILKSCGLDRKADDLRVTAWSEIAAIEG